MQRHCHEGLPVTPALQDQAGEIDTSSSSAFNPSSSAQVLALSCDWVLKASPEVVSRLRSSSLQPGDTLTLPLTLTRRPRVGLCDENEDETAADSQTYYQGPFWSAISAVPIEPSEEEGEMFDKEGTVVSALCREHGYRIKKVRV